MKEKIINLYNSFSKKLWILAKNSFFYLKRKMHWRNIFNLSSLIRVIFVYVSVVVFLSFYTIEYSDGFWKNLFIGNKAEVRFSIYSSNIRSGENLIYKRIQDLANKAGWQYSAAKFDEGLGDFWFTNFLYKSSASLINFIFKPQFNLFLTHHVKILPYGYNIFYLNVPNDILYKKDLNFNNNYIHLQEADAYVDIYTYANGRNPALEGNLFSHDQRYKKIYPYYLAIDKHDSYQEANYDILVPVIIGSLWGCNRNSIRVGLALKKLAKEDMLLGYGHKYALGFLGEYYKGNIESFAESDKENAMEKMYKHYGVSLALHSLEHYLDNIPTSRVLEAVSNGAVVISDDHPFFKKHFGDSMFFINTLKNEDDIYSQVKEHLLWIRSHKEESKQKARIAYQIFLQHFTLSKQFQALVEDIIGKKLSKNINE